MTETSTLRSMIHALPVETEAHSGARLVDPPAPIRPIEYLLLHNRFLDDLIRQQFDRSAANVEGLVFELLGMLLMLYWGHADTNTEILTSPTPYEWTRPCIILAIATENLPFSTEAEMLHYVAAIPKPRHRDDGSKDRWSATRITKDRMPSPSADNLSNEEDEHPQITTRDEVRRLMTSWFKPYDDDDSWPADDDPVGQLRVFEEWIRSRQPPDLAERIQRWLAAGRNTELYQHLGRRRDRAAGAEEIEMLVDELVPARLVTLLVGEPESGKSTVATELIVAVATGRDEWLGRKINRERAKGLAILLTGEDSYAIVNGRLKYLDPDDDARRLVVYALEGRPLADLLAEIKDPPDVSLIVVDPARRYLDGDEDGSANIDKFFAALDEIARHTGAAVMVLHHLRKGASPTNLQQVRDSVRGSSVFMDRPRVALGWFRRKHDDVTIIGAIKCNLPPNYPIAMEIKLRRDAATLRHTPVQFDTPVRADDAGKRDDLERKVLDAIVRLTSQGKRINRTGDRELWAQCRTEFKGDGRNRTRKAVGRLFKDGVLHLGDAGIEVTPATAHQGVADLLPAIAGNAATAGNEFC
jgi:hypothetical protein